MAQAAISADLQSALDPLTLVVANPMAAVAGWKARRGRPVIACMPAYFPLELAVAAGADVIQLWGNDLPPGRADAYLQSFACSLSKSLLEAELGGQASPIDAYAWTSICDTLVNLREIYRRLFEKRQLALEIPQTGSQKTRQRFLGMVLADIRRDLSAITGREFGDDDLRKAAAAAGNVRQLQRELYDLRRKNPGFLSNHNFYTAIKAGSYLPADEYAPLLERLLIVLRAQAKAMPGSRVLVSGMYFEPFAMFAEVFDAAGLQIVDDDLASGSRSIAKTNLNPEDLTAAIERYLFGPLPCCCVHNPALDRRQTLLQQVRDADAQGVVFWYQKFCEPDAFDRPALIQALRQAAVPSAIVEVEMFIRNFEALRNRIGAFAEMLQDQATLPGASR